ncbi:MAG: hypothetical protein R3C18_18955 [Planctomycetaceae bacterium]
MLDVWYAAVPLLLLLAIDFLAELEATFHGNAFNWWVQDHPWAFYTFFGVIVAHNLGLFLAIILVWRSPFSTFDRWKIFGLLLLAHFLIQPLWRFILVPAQADESRRPQALAKFYRWSLIGMAIWTLLCVVIAALDWLRIL